nr:reverse transcriptase domain-containing protein [Tanacetum cinerariifolium]
MANTTPIVTTVMKTATKEKTPNGAKTASRIIILDFCEEHYKDILPVMDKIRRDKRREAIEGKVHSNDLATLTRQARPSPDRTWDTLEMIPIVEVILTNGALLLADIALETEATPTTSKNHMVIPALIEHGTNIGRTLGNAYVVSHVNSTLIGTARQKKYVKDPVEIHNIKQKDGETIEEFMERFKIETGCMKGAPECMRISGFMHGVNNPELIKRLNEPSQRHRRR